MSDLIKALASNMVSRKRTEIEPYIIFLGAGASISSGCSSMMQIVDDVLKSHEEKHFDNWNKEIQKAESVHAEYGGLLIEKICKQKRELFFKVWSRLDSDTKYSILRKHLWEDKSPSDGYINLAHLIKMGYIKIVLSTNLDNLVEKALNNVDWHPPDNFIVIVNRKDRPEELREQLESSRAPFKLIKLHGTLESPGSYAFIPEEVFDFEKAIKPTLSRIINQSLIVIGHSMEDRDIDMLFDDEGKEIHFVNPSSPEIGSRIDTILKVRRQGSLIKGDDGEFDNFFSKLRSYIEEKADETIIRDSIPSIEGFLRSIGYDHELEVPRSRFKNLPTLYVNPTEYDDICSKLEREHVVFIIGEPHLGKTYTAFYLLWEYYKKGYELFHIRHDRLVTLLHQHNSEMKNLLVELFASEKGLPRIIHFDDPFGETMERRTEAFAKELDTFLDLVRGYEHLRVIVTTRLSIFRESIAEVHDRKKVEELEKDIRVHTSYSRDILLDILHRYTHFYNPLWATDGKIIEALDEKLPDLLPAPHNIEFFVRTSERLSSLDEVIRHVENSKEMIKALGNWMASLPDHEQLFLIWLEICSTTVIIFPDTTASKIDFEAAYMETLAYMFKKKHISGIPTSPLSRTRDKFDMILIESRDRETESVKYDFVHPSYHEAFWYAVQRKLPLHRWWQLLKENVGEIVKELENKVDIVQLRMIEQYGIINRDLDQLLLISAESNDVNEQLIAFGHMVERLEQFANIPQFSHCALSVIKSKNPEHRDNFLDLVYNCFNQLPLDVLKVFPQLLFDPESEIRVKAEKIILKYFDAIPESVKQSETLKAWRVVKNIFLPSEKHALYGIVDAVSATEETFSVMYNHEDLSEELFNRFLKISPDDLQQLLKIKHFATLKSILKILDITWKHLSSKQKKIIPINDLLTSENDNIVQSSQLLILHHLEDFSHLSEKYSFVQELNLLRKIFNIPMKAEEDIIEQFKSMSIDDWTKISPDLLKRLINSTLNALVDVMINKILKHYDKLSQKQRNAFVTSQSSSRFTKFLNKYINYLKFSYNSLSDSALIDLLKFPGYVQYEVVPMLLIRFGQLSKKAKHVVNEFISNPPDWWIGGSVGQITSMKYKKKLSKEVKYFPIKLSSHPNKLVVGALLAELAQNNYDKDIRLQKIYKDILYELSKDPEALYYAQAWMDYQLKSFGFQDKEYWSKVKKHLINLSKRDKLTK